jgi:hypothetical protein
VNQGPTWWLKKSDAAKSSEKNKPRRYEDRGFVVTVMKRKDLYRWRFIRTGFNGALVLVFSTGLDRKNGTYKN